MAEKDRLENEIIEEVTSRLEDLSSKGEEYKLISDMYRCIMGAEYVSNLDVLHQMVIALHDEDVQLLKQFIESCVVLQENGFSLQPFLAKTTDCGLNEVNRILGMAANIVNTGKPVAVGVTRRIDDLGRVVIPKEMRIKLKIHESDVLSMILLKDGIYLKKENTTESLMDKINDLDESLNNMDIDEELFNELKRNIKMLRDGLSK